MREVLTRRFRRHLAQQADAAEALASGDAEAAAAVAAVIDPQTGKPRRFAYAPQLVVVDGGLPQVNAAQAVLEELGVDDVALVGLAKRLEEVWLPGDEFPVILPRSSEGLYLLQRVRDEAHRFAIAFHRQRRSKAMTASALDGIPGLGEARQRALLKAFGSVKRLREADVAELQTVKGVGPALAQTVHDRLRGGAAAVQPDINLTTGEVLD